MCSEHVASHVRFSRCDHVAELVSERGSSASFSEGIVCDLLFEVVDVVVELVDFFVSFLAVLFLHGLPELVTVGLLLGLVVVKLHHIKWVEPTSLCVHWRQILRIRRSRQATVRSSVLRVLKSLRLGKFFVDDWLARIVHYKALILCRLRHLRRSKLSRVQLETLRILRPTWHTK